MGYSATVLALDEVKRWDAFCIAQTGSQNVYLSAGDAYFYEVGRENSDGAVTGSVWRFLGRFDAPSSTCQRAGTFRVNPDGSVARWPVGLKRVYLGSK